MKKIMSVLMLSMMLVLSTTFASAATLGNFERGVDSTELIFNVFDYEKNKNVPIERFSREEFVKLIHNPVTRSKLDVDNAFEALARYDATIEALNEGTATNSRKSTEGGFRSRFAN